MTMNVNRNQGTGKEHYKGKKCDYYHFLGHTKDNCYKLIGYPSDWKQRKKPGYGNGNGNMRNGTRQINSMAIKDKVQEILVDTEEDISQQTISLMTTVIILILHQLVR